MQLWLKPTKLQLHDRPWSNVTHHSENVEMNMVVATELQNTRLYNCDLELMLIGLVGKYIFAMTLYNVYWWHMANVRRSNGGYVRATITQVTTKPVVSDLC